MNKKAILAINAIHADYTMCIGALEGKSVYGEQDIRNNLDLVKDMLADSGYIGSADVSDTIFNFDEQEDFFTIDECDTDFYYDQTYIWSKE